MTSRKRTLALPRGEKKPAAPFVRQAQQHCSLENIEKENIRICCQICGIDISKFSFEERNTHVNACIDRMCCPSEKIVPSKPCPDSDFLNPTQHTDRVPTRSQNSVSITLEEDSRDVLALSSLSNKDGGCVGFQNHSAEKMARPTTRPMKPPSANDVLMRGAKKCNKKEGMPIARGNLREVEDSLMRLRMQLNDIEELVAEQEYRKTQIHKELKKLMRRQLQLENDERKRLLEQEGLFGVHHVPTITPLEDMVSRVFDAPSPEDALYEPKTDAHRHTKQISPLWSLSHMTNGFDEAVSTSSLSELPVLDLAVPKQIAVAHHQHPYFANRLSAMDPDTNDSTGNNPCPEECVDAKTSSLDDNDTSQPMKGFDRPVEMHSPSALSQLLSALESQPQSQPHDDMHIRLRNGSKEGISRTDGLNVDSAESLFATMGMCVDDLRRRCADGGRLSSRFRCRELLNTLQRTCFELRGAMTLDIVLDIREDSGDDEQILSRRVSDVVSEQDTKQRINPLSSPDADVICLDLDDLIPATPATERKFSCTLQEESLIASDRNIAELDTIPAGSSPACPVVDRKRPLLEAANCSGSEDRGDLTSHSRSVTRTCRRHSGTSSLVHALTPSGRVSVDSGGSEETLAQWAAAASSRIFTADTPWSQQTKDNSSIGMSFNSQPSSQECVGVGISCSVNGNTPNAADSFDRPLEGVVHYIGDASSSPVRSARGSPSSLASTTAREQSAIASEDVDSTWPLVCASNSQSAVIPVKWEVVDPVQGEPAAYEHVQTVSDSPPERLIDHRNEPDATTIGSHKRAAVGTVDRLVSTFTRVTDTESHQQYDIVAMSTRPDLTDYSVQELKQICKSYGIKQSESRKFMTSVLVGLWERYHGVVSNDEVAVMDGRGNDGINDGVPGDEVDATLTDAVLNYIRCYDMELYERVLSFQPLNIDEVRTKLIFHGVKVSKVSLRNIFDKEGIFVCCT